MREKYLQSFLDDMLSQGSGSPQAAAAQYISAIADELEMEELAFALQDVIMWLVFKMNTTPEQDKE